jgi:F0F1-type ATP synthase assembly protein I
MSQLDPRPNDRKQKILNLTLAVVAGQVGCLTLVILLLAVFLGLWLDNQYGTKPTFTIGLLLGSIPVSLIVMFAVVRAAIRRIKVKPGDGSIQDESIR